MDTSSQDGSVTITDNTATFTPNADFNGTASFTYLVTDGELASESSTVSITVNAVNDAPELVAIQDQSIDEDTVLSLTLSASDVDGDNLDYYTVVVGDASGDITDNVLTVTPDLNSYGDVSVTVAATDGEYTATQSFTLTVNPVNDAPTLKQGF